MNMKSMKRTTRNTGARRGSVMLIMAIAVVGLTGLSVALVMDDGEFDYGADDDGNGLVDERKLVLTLNVGTGSQRQITLCRGIPSLYPGEMNNGIDDNGNGVVDENGFSVQRVGDLLYVRLAVAVPVEGGQVAAWPCESALVLHN